MHAIPTDTAGPAVITMLEGLLRGGPALCGLPPDSAEALYALAHQLYQQAQYAEAARLFAFLVMLNACDLRFHMGLGASKQMLRRHQEALRHYAVASLLDTTDPTPLLRSAECFLSLGKRAEARERLRLALGQAEDAPRHAHAAPRVRALIELLDNAPARPSTEVHP